jgi:hypothetical protein
VLSISRPTKVVRGSRITFTELPALPRDLTRRPGRTRLLSWAFLMPRTAPGRSCALELLPMQAAGPVQQPCSNPSKSPEMPRKVLASECRRLQAFCKLWKPPENYRAALAWRRSRVRVSSGPLTEILITTRETYDKEKGQDCLPALTTPTSTPTQPQCRQLVLIRSHLPSRRMPDPPSRGGSASRCQASWRWWRVRGVPGRSSGGRPGPIAAWRTYAAGRESGSPGDRLSLAKARRNASRGSPD